MRFWRSKQEEDKSGVDRNPICPGQDFMLKVFEQMGCRHEHIIIPNIVLRRGEELQELYVCPQRIGDVYGSEEAARRDLGENETLYRVNVGRVE